MRLGLRANVRTIMTFRSFLFASALTAAFVGGCSKKEGGDSAEKTVEKKREKADQPVTAAFFGTKVAPVGPLAKIAWGSTPDDAKKAAPELFVKADKKGSYTSDPALAGVSYGVSFSKDGTKVDRLYVQIPAAAKALVAQAWGAGAPAKDTIDRERTYWFDAATGWRAYLEAGFGDDFNVDFSQYLPAAKLLGEGPDTLGFAPEPLLGATLEQLRTRYKAQLIETDEAAAKKQQEELSKFTGKDLDKEIGKAKPSVRIDLLPTEWESYWTRVQISWDDEGKVSRFWFKLPFDAHPAAKEELKAMLDKKWGAPKEGKEFGSSGSTIFIYREAEPRITVKEDTISNGWDVFFDAKAN